MSLCAAFFSYGFSRVYHLPNSNFWLVFTGTLFVYLGQRYYKMWRKDISTNSNRLAWMNGNKVLVKTLMFLSFLSFSSIASLYMFHHPSTIVLFVISGLISILYVVKIGRWNLREIPFLKVFMVVAAYFILTIGLHMKVEHIPFNRGVVSFLFLLFGLTILFDIPDRKIDSASNKTFAQVLGIKRTILLSAFFVSLYFLLKSYVGGESGIAINAIWALVMFTFYIKLPKRVDSEFYLAFFGEGILGLIGLNYFLIS